MAILALVRHGQSTWNEQKKFTGWHDVIMTTEGENEVAKAATILKGIEFDLAFTSELTRAKDSLQIVLQKLGAQSIPTFSHHALNERDYGDLTGRTHAEVIEQYGKAQFNKWHRSWDNPPPHGESLKDTYNRVNHFYQEQIMPELIKGKNVLVVASSNSLRALRKRLESISDQSISSLETPTGQAILYEVNGQRVKKLS